MSEIKILIVSDTAISVVFGDKISNETNNQVNKLSNALKNSKIEGITELCPAYCSLMISYNPAALSYKKLCRKVKALAKSKDNMTCKKPILWEIPVCYGGKYGEDLDDTANFLGISPDELITRHSNVTYKIYMLGFLPGFAYLGGLDSSICAPRLSSPRKKIPAGSVGIGGKQTGIYPMSSPGGWRLIGTTPIDVYDLNRPEPILYSAGDYLKFTNVTVDEFEQIKTEILNKTYKYKSKEWSGEE